MVTDVVDAGQGDADAVMETYKKLLTYIDSAVAKNYSEKSINNLMDRITTGEVSFRSPPDASSHLPRRAPSSCLESLWSLSHVNTSRCTILCTISSLDINLS